MSLIENLVNQISTNGLSGIVKPQGFDLNDNTFENLLQKATEFEPKLNENLQMLGNIGQPAGMIIEPFEKTDSVQPINQENTIQPEPFEIKDVDTGKDYFSNLLREAPQEHKVLMNVTKKYVSAIYSNLDKNIVDNLADFAKGAISLT